MCKTKFFQKAINIALQNLICIFTDNKQLLQSNVIEDAIKEKEEEDNIVKINRNEYGERLKDLDMRLRIMNEEKMKMEI